MDIEQDQLIGWWKRTQAALLAVLVRLLRCTWRVRTHDSLILNDAIENGGAVIAFWHGEQLPMVPLHACDRIAGLASHSSEGSIAADVIRRFGYRVIRGSSSRGALSALLGCRQAIAAGVSPAIAVDGPRGPRYQVGLGALGLSARSGTPIVYVVSSASRAWTLQSWDGFQIPWPGARVDIAYGRMEPPSSDRAGIEAGAQELRERMLALGAQLRTSALVPSDA